MAQTLDWASFSAKVAEFLGLEIRDVLEKTHIYDELGLDSLGMFSLGMYLIKNFGITLPLSEVANIETLGDLYAALDRYRPNES